MDQTKSYRIASIDTLRGLIMIIMAIDHVRDFFYVDGLAGDPLDLATTTPALFFTRWITHFCAPLFVFLSGISASISMSREGASGKSLIKRGLSLILIELTVITFGITFNPFYNVLIFQVIWAIGISMVILGLLSSFSRKLIFGIGIILVFGHDLLNYVDLPVTGVSGYLWQLILTSKAVFLPVGDSHYIAIFYAALPWTGVMLLGYCAGIFFKSDFPSEQRKKILLWLGVGSLGLFLILRLINLYGDPAPWTTQPDAFHTFLSFIKVSKYPPSLMYCLITIGTGLIFLSFMDSMKNKITGVLTDYGRVPFFYYILHFYLIHVFLIVLFFASGFTSNEIVTPQDPFLFRPPQFGFSLPVMYLIWAAIVLLLYKPCIWYWGYKNRHKDKWWTRYV